MKVLSTKNKQFGFYGTALSITNDEGYVNQLWHTTSTMIQEMSELTSKQTRLILDSRYGRHLADCFYSNIKKGIKNYQKAFLQTITEKDLYKNYYHFVDEKDFYSNTFRKDK